MTNALVNEVKVKYGFVNQNIMFIPESKWPLVLDVVPARGSWHVVFMEVNQNGHKIKSTWRQSTET